MDRLEALYSALENEADTQRQQRDGERQARAALESENVRLREALTQLEHQAATAASVDADAHQQALAQAQKALADERRERAALSEQLSAARQQLQERQTQLNDVNEALLARDAQLQELRSQNAQAVQRENDASAHSESQAAETVPVPGAYPAQQDEAAAEQLAAGRVSEAHEVAEPQAEPSSGVSDSDGDAVTNEPSPEDTSDKTPPSPHALLKQWLKRYPDTFFKGHTRPLKIGIHVELLENEPWDEKLVRRALAGYVHLPRYLKAVRPGTQRVDLAGQSVGVVTEDEALHARQQLDELTRQQKAREEQAADQRISHKLSELMTKHRP